MIILMIMLLVAIPVSAYDYQGVPDQSSDSTDTVSDDTAAATPDFSSLLGSVDISNLISSILLIIFRLLGISLPSLY